MSDAGHDGSIAVAIARLGFADPAGPRRCSQDPALTGLDPTRSTTSSHDGLPDALGEAADPDQAPCSGWCGSWSRCARGARARATPSTAVPAARRQRRPAGRPPARPGPRPAARRPRRLDRPRSTTSSRHPEHWRCVAEATRPTADGLREQPGRRGRTGPGRGERPATTPCASPTGEQLLGIAALDLTSSDPMGYPADRRGAARRARARRPSRPALAIAREEYGAGADGRPARGHRHGQDRRRRAELRLRRRRHLRRRARRGGRRGARARRRHRPGDAADAGLLGQHRPRARCGRSTPPCAPRARTGRWCAPSPATGPTTSAGRRPGSSRPCSRRGSSAGDLEVGTGLQGRDPADGVGRRGPRPLRRGRAGDAPPGRAARPASPRPTASSSSGRVACATSSSPCSCSSSCTGAATSRCGPRPPSRGCRRSPKGGYVGARGRRDPRRGLPAAAHPRAPDPAATGCAARTSCPPARPTCAASAGPSGYGSPPPRRSSSCVRRGPARCAGIHERLFYRPLLDAVAKLTVSRHSPHAGGRPGAARSARLPRPGRRDAPPRVAHLGRHAGGPRSSGPLLPVMLGWFADEADPDAGLLAFRRVSDELGTIHWYLKMLRDEGSSAERLARDPGVAAGTRRTSSCGRPSRVAILGEPGGLHPARPEQLRLTLGSAAGRRPDADAATASVMQLRRHELLRIAIADLAHEIDLAEVGRLADRPHRGHHRRRPRARRAQGGGAGRVAARHRHGGHRDGQPRRTRDGVCARTPT